MSRPAVEALEIGALRSGETAAAVSVLARGMRDNPNHVAMFGPDPAKRVRALERGFAAYFRVVTAQAPLCAQLDGVVLGVAGVRRWDRAERRRPAQGGPSERRVGTAQTLSRGARI